MDRTEPVNAAASGDRLTREEMIEEVARNAGFIGRWLLK